MGWAVWAPGEFLPAGKFKCPDVSRQPSVVSHQPSAKKMPDPRGIGRLLLKTVLRGLVAVMALSRTRIDVAAYLARREYRRMHVRVGSAVADGIDYLLESPGFDSLRGLSKHLRRCNHPPDGV